MIVNCLQTNASVVVAIIMFQSNKTVESKPDFGVDLGCWHSIVQFSPLAGSGTPWTSRRGSFPRPTWPWSTLQLLGSNGICRWKDETESIKVFITCERLIKIKKKEVFIIFSSGRF